MGNHNANVNDKPMLPPSVRTVEIQDVSSKPKLSMKYLHELILELQHENRMLAGRLDELERSMSEYRSLQNEFAAAAEMPASSDPIPDPSLGLEAENTHPQIEMLITAVLEHDPTESHEAQNPQPESGIPLESPIQNSQSEIQCRQEYLIDLPRPILTPRSVRHPSRKRTFWSMFRFRIS